MSLLDHLRATPALDRLAFLLDGLAGTPNWQLGDALDPGFVAAIAPIDFAELTKRRSRSLAPLTVIAIESPGWTARARLLHPDGSRQVLTCTVADLPPHRITSTSLQPEIPDNLAPRLAADLSVPMTPEQRLVVVAGVPGSGKSTLADALGRRLGVPVFSLDWLLGALTPFGGRHLDDLLLLGYEQLVTLAFRQLSAGQSAVLDGPFEDEGTRARLRALAGTGLRVIVCRCSDTAAHRSRLLQRKRDIPGWHDAGDWTDVTRRTAEFPPWPEAMLLDTSDTPDAILATATSYVEA